MGERPTRYFYQLENQRQTRNLITELRVKNSIVTSDQTILRQCREFYREPYSAEPVDIASQDWLLNQLDKSLASEDQAKCEGLLTLSECSEALSQMSTGKSPGADGLPSCLESIRPGPNRCPQFLLYTRVIRHASTTALQKGIPFGLKKLAANFFAQHRL